MKIVVVELMKNKIVFDIKLCSCFFELLKLGIDVWIIFFFWLEVFLKIKRCGFLILLEIVFFRN